MGNELKINLTPTIEDLNVIEKWLKIEVNKYKSGFYCNWNIIEKSFKSNRLISLEFNNDVIGFLIYSVGDIYIEIDIMEVCLDYRRKGFGKIFFEQFEDVLRKQNVLAIKLFCEPRESEFFWRKMGFIKFPERGYSESDLTFYKPIIEVKPTTENPNSFNKLELWDVEPYQVANIGPRWSWNIELQNGKLLKPIIQPCNVNWNLRWTNNGEIVKEDKVKYFSNSENPIEFSPFMYVRQLKE
jgi:GNAT superfamily N-acetyltransferase